ncbi:MAG: hypothetical protein M1828_007519 [Chrysothrix sp. TS-e1954]|nr:MAG: hypothetical protein M1828_007519 [Chrysothrix sp. TS-e1954]
MPINYLILLSRQGKVRLAKWFTTLAPKDKAKIVKDVTQLVLARRARMCNFLEYRDTKIVYRRYASLFFIAGCASTDNELITLEIVHRYVEQMDKYYGNVCELDIIFNFQKAYFILDELLLAGEMQESSKKNVLRCISQQDSLEDMEYLPTRELENVTSALNFDTKDCHVEGGCDLYITKAAARKERLYKDIEKSLEDQHASLVRFSASLSPPNAELLDVDLSRPSPFGPLSERSNRRTFAYMVATLNASHPDYDFTDILKPTDFIPEKSLRSVMARIDETMYTLRPRGRPGARSALSAPQTPGGSQTWNPSMWRAVDKEMTLQDCGIYQYTPATDPFDSEDSAIWSHHYFFFNKERKRVCYIYIRGITALGHSPARTPKRARPLSSASLSIDAGASKRAKYWLGDRAKGIEGGWDDEDDHEFDDPGDDEVDAEDALHDGSIAEQSNNDGDDEDDDDELERRYREKSSVRRMSEHLVESMDA